MTNKEQTKEVIELTDVERFGRLSGTDANGCHWVQEEYDCGLGDENTPVDEFGDGGHECDACGAVVQSGWILLDGGEFFCNGDNCSVEITWD